MTFAAGDRVALAGAFAQVARHQHAVPAIVVGLDGPLQFVATRSHVSRAVLIAPGFAHAVVTRESRLAMFVLPPHALGGDSGRGVSAAPVRDLPDAGAWVELGAAVLAGRLADFTPVDHQLGRAGACRRDFSDRARELRPLDDRVRRALDRLDASLDQNLAIEDLAAEARLSPSRLMALVRSQLGTSLRSYRRWRRAFSVARDYARGASLTDAALAAGFASSAHLSAAARAHFGIRPSDILAPHNRGAIRA